MVVATPIGNAGDLGLRACEVLEQADRIACEDTRVTGKLLKIHGIATPMTAYHEYNAVKVRPMLIERLEKGETVALVSDAGTPLVSDPGFCLVRACLKKDLPVTAVPGPSATINALVLSGLPADRFMFAGYLPAKAGRRRAVLAELATVRVTLILLESPRRLAASLADMAQVLGNRKAAVTREMTKMFEEVRRDRLEVLAAAYAEAGPPKGEVTVVVGPPEAPPQAQDLDILLQKALKSLSVKEASAQVAAEAGVSRRKAYQRALALLKEKPA